MSVSYSTIFSEQSWERYQSSHLSFGKKVYFPKWAIKYKEEVKRKSQKPLLGIVALQWGFQKYQLRQAEL